MTCAASRYGDHDYSQPPHNTPDNPRTPGGTDDPCEAHFHDAQCAMEGRYEIVIYQIATHDWIRMVACGPCTASIRRRHMTLGPRGTQGVFSVRSLVGGSRV